MTPVVSPLIIATLHLPQVITKVKPWLGWNIVFVTSITDVEIKIRTPFIEQTLNDYLQRNVDVTANHLIVPFTNKMEATANRLIYTFKIRVYTIIGSRETQLFNYPFEPVKKVDGFVIEKVMPGTSHVNTVSLKPPPN